MRIVLLLLSAVFLIVSFIFIQNKKEEPINISFYHWENSYNQKEIKQKVYVKVLDISYSSKIEVINTIFQTKANDIFVPVVYITNDTMKNVDYSIISNQIIRNLKSTNLSFEELQIDCDWSSSTQSNYFKLLEDLKIKLNKTLSATIRLHQIKYYVKTGIPPVDYGVLMYYNMSDISDINTKNSILDNDIAKKYHYNFDSYKLKLKLALPLYSQAIQFRENKALDIFEGAEKKDFDENFKALDNNKYEVINSTYFKGRYVYKGDIFRFEDSEKEDIKIAFDDFFKISKNRFNEVIFYTLKYENKYDLEKLIKGKQ
ncbi:hypothetical protein AVENP_1126 [Arcobacter venerupis]|uniref:Uncharacterized protein n=1 Tax=Arcobacter venerupis TaxID=1054033 RepID=A0AAE7B8Q7_9BACT|nr:hypothetical protein [Arcobacter venerupis]QKF66681.1 hypothetical protein AVENP_1126 [Arcobacter venerupis]RWS49588.1 hypothetical protein CKA56_07650 [Arcobacter venerupis]